MNSSAIQAAIVEIASVSGKLEKQKLLDENMEFSRFARVIQLGLNPFITYGIAKVEDSMVCGTEDFDEATFQLLDDLAQRKLTGNNAREALLGEQRRLNIPSAELLKWIIKKDFRAGFGPSSVNKAKKGTIPTFPYQRCSLPKDTKLKEWNWANGIISQEKADGLFCNLTVEIDGTIGMTTRQGTPLPVDSFPEIASFAARMMIGGTQTHGEILVEVDGVVAPRQIGNGIINRIVDGGEFEANERPILRVWDQLPLSAVVPKGKYLTKYGARLAGLIKQITLEPEEGLSKSASPVIKQIDTRIVYSIAEAYKHYSELLKLGKEGTIIKTREAIWKDGTSKEQVKLKLEAPCELEVIDFNAGNGKNADTFGSLLCRTSDGQLEVNVSGFTDALRAEIHANRVHWKGAIITVMSNSIMEPSPSNPICSLYLPRFVDRRVDKDTADTLEQVRKQFAAAIRAVEDMA